MTGRVLRHDRAYPETCRINPSVVYVFGDNVLRRGKAGQACIRDEPNAIGVPTKWNPSMCEDAFFSDQDWAEPEDDASYRQRLIAREPNWRSTATLTGRMLDGLGAALQLNRNVGRCRRVVMESLILVEAQLAIGFDVSFPADGLGTGLAQLPQRAPRIHDFIEGRIAELSTIYGTGTFEGKGLLGR